MSRGLSSTITDELAKGQFTMANMISIETNLSASSPSDEAGNYFYTDAPVDIQNVVSGQTEKFIFRANITAESATVEMEEKTKYGQIQTFVEQVKVGYVCDDYLVDRYNADLGRLFPVGTTVTAIGAITNDLDSGLSSLTLTFSEEAIRTENRASIYFEGTPVLHYTYKTNGFILGLDGVKETSNLNIGSLTLGVSSVNQTLISDMLANGHLNRRVKIRRAFLDSNNDLIPNAIFQVYSGRIDGMNITESGEDSVMELSVANHWSDFNRDNGRQTNNASQQHHFENDLSMEFAPQTGKKLLWGEVTNPASAESRMMQGTRSTRRGR